MNRRMALKSLLLVGAGGAGYAVYSEGYTPVDITIDNGPSGPPPTNAEIGRNDFDTGPFDWMALYESGAAEIYFELGHDTDRFGITHSSLSTWENSFRTWDSPTYEGPVVIDLQEIIQNNGPYPTNDFKIGVYFDPSEAFHLGDSTAKFSVPDDWYDTYRTDG